MLKKLGVNVLICNGIEEHARNMLETQDCLVISGVVGTGADALYGYLAGKFRTGDNLGGSVLTTVNVQPHTADLVVWTRDLFKKLGWDVKDVSDSAPFPIDLVVEKLCPICKKKVRVAVCCGAHAYRVEKEIQEFRRVTMTGYNARVYVHQTMPKIVENCRDYEIELLDPEAFVAAAMGQAAKNTLPPLSGAVNGHEKLV